MPLIAAVQRVSATAAVSELSGLQLQMSDHEREACWARGRRGVSYLQLSTLTEALQMRLYGCERLTGPAFLGPVLLLRPVNRLTVNNPT